MKHVSILQAWTIWNGMFELRPFTNTIKRKKKGYKFTIVQNKNRTRAQKSRNDGILESHHHDLWYFWAKNTFHHERHTQYGLGWNPVPGTLEYQKGIATQKEDTNDHAGKDYTSLVNRHASTRKPQEKIHVHVKGKQRLRVEITTTGDI